MKTYSMADMLAYSRGIREASDIATIKNLIKGCTWVKKTDEETDKTGIDYIAGLTQGALVTVDGKTRKPGCSKYWRSNEPELALETWSVKPRDGSGGKIGWTLNQATSVDYILFTWPPQDCDKVFLYPFQYLRIAFHTNMFSWQGGKYKIGMQDSDAGRWQSECIFVPESIVWDAVRKIMTGQQVQPDGAYTAIEPAVLHDAPVAKRTKPTPEDFGYSQGDLFKP